MPLPSASLISVIASTVIALASGTNYAYSAWAPAFADRLKLSSTEINLIGMFGNMGMYMTGIPFGILVDSKGPRLSVLLGSIFMGCGYFGCYRAYQGGAGSISVPSLCLLTGLAGTGSCASFTAALKTAALNYPTRRGTATAFPLATFGLSAFFFSSISALAFPDNTADLLLLFSLATSCVSFLGIFFLRVQDHAQGYTPLSGSDRGHKTGLSIELEKRRANDGRANHSHKFASGSTQFQTKRRSASETSSEPEIQVFGKDAQESDSYELDVRGIAMLSHARFYQVWILLGLFSGIGLMTINNIGSDTRALWRHWDDSIPIVNIQHQQFAHVEVLSLMSFTGRLLSGIGSDLLVHQFSLSRFWCLVASASLFILAQTAAATITTPILLFLVSGLTGLAYGCLFGFYPALIAELFGIQGMSRNWGFMTISSVIGGPAFNTLYGLIFDSHSTIKGDGSRDCSLGRECYRSAYLVTLFLAFIGLLASLASVKYDRPRTRREAKVEDYEAYAA